MKVLLLGTGAALHALTWKIVSEAAVEQVHCSPGNAGTALLLGTPPFSPEHGAEVAQWAFSQLVDLVVVQGMPARVDMLAGVGLPVLGAGEEGWHALSRRQSVRALLQSQRIPCPEGQAFCDRETAERYLASRPLPLWIRSEDTAQREAVRVSERYEAFQQLARLLSLDPETGVCIEEDIAGPEVSLALLSDGQRAISLGVSRPYDRRYEGETGRLTEGMGAYAPYGEQVLEDRLLAEVGRPVVTALAAASLLRPAFLQVRMILGEKGAVVCGLSWGLDDLHAAVVLPRWGGDLAGLLGAAARGRLPEQPPLWQPGVAVAVALVAEGYPGPCPQGEPLYGLYDAEALVFHHATRLQADSSPFSSAALAPWLRRPNRPAGLTRRVVTAGGRVLLVVGLASTGAAARGRAYKEVGNLGFPHCAWRRDIAAELL